MIEALKETVLEAPDVYVAWGGLLIGLVFGYLVFRTNFCTMGALSDLVSFGDKKRLRSWLLAGATALIGAQLLHYAGAVDLSTSMYLQPTLTWVGNVLGGLLFGFGMVFAGGCVSRNLARLGGGDIGSLMVLIVAGLFSYITIGGFLGPIRAALAGFAQIDMGALGSESQGLDAVVNAATGGASGGVIMTVLIAGAMLVYCFKDSQFRTSMPHVLGGIGIGLCAAAGWALTGLAFDELGDNPVNPISLTYVRPAGDTLEYLTRFTAFGLPGFGVVTVFGAILGSYLAAISMKRFRLSAFADVSDTLRNLGGAALMGIGGVMALGCTVGQAVTGISTLAIGSFITFAAIVAGGIGGLKYMEWRIMSQA
ncbi:MAG: YeeE/YedE family protein [Pseudomonadota bacterium]